MISKGKTVPIGLNQCHAIIAVKNTVGLVATDLLGDLAGHACPIHVPNCGASQVMKEPFDWQASFLTRGLPCFIKRLDGMATVRSHIAAASECSMKHS